MDKGFTIVIPAYNEEEAVVGTLKSVFDAAGSKKKDSFEIIIVDAGSDDETAGLAAKVLSTSGFNGKVIRMNGRTMPGAARNAGIKEASNDNIILIDSDVRISSALIDECIENAGYDFIWFKSRFVFKSRIEGAYVRPYFAYRKKGRHIRHCMVKKETVDILGYFRGDLRAAEDWLFYREVQKEDFNELFSSLKAECRGFPDSLKSFYRKWTEYFENSVYAGLHKGNIRNSAIQIAFIVLLLTGSLAAGVGWVISLLGSAALFTVLRGFVSFFRSRIPPSGSTDILYTLITSLVLEISRINGVARGLIRRGK